MNVITESASRILSKIQFIVTALKVKQEVNATKDCAKTTATDKECVMMVHVNAMMDIKESRVNCTNVHLIVGTEAHVNIRSVLVSADT